MKCLTDVGLSPMEVLEAATKTAAQVSTQVLEGELVGTIEEGKLADLVVWE